MKKALITGITGQDGSYLAEFLLKNRYKVFGLERYSSQKTRKNIEHILSQIELISGDLLDELSIIHALKEINPDEVYNFAAPIFIPDFWKQAVLTGDVTALGTVRLLEAIRQVNPQIKFYQASSSEIFGLAREAPQNEETPFRPRNLYGIAKLYAHWVTVNFREHYGLFAVSGISFNHESPRRALESVARKITHTVAGIKLGLAKELVLGDLNARRDWGFAGDYIEAMWLMLQQEKPDDYVIATGEPHSVQEFVETAFNHVGLDWKKYVRTDQKFLRSAESYILMGDASRVHRELGWKPKVKFEELVKMMVDSDLSLLSK